MATQKNKRKKKEKERDNSLKNKRKKITTPKKNKILGSQQVSCLSENLENYEKIIMNNNKRGRKEVFFWGEQNFTFFNKKKI
jgi:hypothetical protein